MSPGRRLFFGVTLLIAGALMPLAIVPLMQMPLPDGIKAVISGILFFGFEIMALPAVAIMGKDNYARITGKIKNWLAWFRPSGQPGRLRYNTGLLLFVLPVLLSYIPAYLPQWLPDYPPQRFWICFAADLMFLLSLFVLGGGFWDKLRALFYRKAYAVFPGKSAGDDKQG